MENLLQEIDQIIDNLSKEINEKIIGINYLETLKYFLINELKKNNYNSFNEFKNIEISKKCGQNDLNIVLENFVDSNSKIKTIISNTRLTIVLSGSKSLKIFENNETKQSHSIFLHPFSGIVSSRDIVINELINKNTLLLNIFNINKNIDVEK